MLRIFSAVLSIRRRLRRFSKNCGYASRPDCRATTKACVAGGIFLLERLRLVHVPLIDCDHIAGPDALEFRCATPDNDALPGRCKASVAGSGDCDRAARSRARTTLQRATQQKAAYLTPAGNRASKTLARRKDRHWRKVAFSRSIVSSSFSQIGHPVVLAGPFAQVARDLAHDRHTRIAFLICLRRPLHHGGHFFCLLPTPRQFAGDAGRVSTQADPLLGVDAAARGIQARSGGGTRIDRRIATGAGCEALRAGSGQPAQRPSPRPNRISAVNIPCRSAFRRSFKGRNQINPWKI